MPLDNQNMLKYRLRQLFIRFPVPLQNVLRRIVRLNEYIPFTSAYAKRQFLKRVYMKRITDDRLYIFSSISRFCVANRPIQGYYFEFGCHSAGTMRMAYDHFRHLFDWDYVAFDSFEGLPEISEIDRQPIWEQGKLITSEEEFTRIVTQHGLPYNKLTTVKGFYDDSLTDDLKDRLAPGKAAVIYVDCDLYASTVPVLEFVKGFLQTGTIIVFDDWNCFHGDPDKGERRAFAEFKSRYPKLNFEEFVSTHMQKAFIFTGDKR